MRQDQLVLHQFRLIDSLLRAGPKPLELGFTPYAVLPTALDSVCPGPHMASQRPLESTSAVATIAPLSLSSTDFEADVPQTVVLTSRCITAPPANMLANVGGVICAIGRAVVVCAHRRPQKTSTKARGIWGE